MKQGDDARGAIITQVFPLERSLASPIVKEAIALATAKRLGGVTPARSRRARSGWPIIGPDGKFMR